MTSDMNTRTTDRVDADTIPIGATGHDVGAPATANPAPTTTASSEEDRQAVLLHRPRRRRIAAVAAGLVLTGATGLLAVRAVDTAQSRPAVSDRSSETAEQRRMNNLGANSQLIGQSDAERVSTGGTDGDSSPESAEVHRMEVLRTVSDTSWEVAEARRMARYSMRSVDGDLSAATP